MPMIGIKTAWIHQKITDTYYNTLPGSGELGMKDIMHYINQYWCIGIEAGVQSTWGLGKGFNILGNVASSNITGIYHLALQEKFDNEIVGNTYEKPHATKAITDFQLGVRWEKLLNDCFYLMLQAAWEQHIYYNQLQWQGSVPTATPNGDLGFSSYSFYVRLGF